MGTTSRWFVGVGLCLALVGLGACSGGDDQQAATESSGAADAGSGSGGGSAERSALLTSGGAEAASQQATEGRDVISTAKLTVEVDDAPEAAERARTIATDAGGYLSSAEAELTGDQRAQVQLRVPAEQFEAVLAELGELGEVEDRSIGTQDVTDEVVDLEVRLENARVSVDRLRELLAKAENLNNIIAIEDRLTQRETEIEQLTGQLQVLEDQVAMSTIDATFAEEGDPEVSDDLPGFVEAAENGVAAVGSILLGLAAVAGFALPFLPFVVVGWLGWRWWRRRQPERVKAPFVPGSPLPPPPAPPSPLGDEGAQP